MRILNPIYDVAFKYLMEDIEIAKNLIGKIIGEEITSLTLQARELTSKSEEYKLLIFRLDFKATILTKDGTYKTILIELQKAKMYDDLLRFRRYLGENYRKKVELPNQNGKIEKKTLPIITIYFLGFLLPKINTSILKINREYIDLISGKKLNITTEFVEKLTHDSYIILIPQLPPKERTELEGILKVFNQTYQSHFDSQLLEINEADFADTDLMKMMIKRLRRGATDEKILNKMDIEEEVETALDNQIREKEKLKEEIKSHKDELKSKEEEIQEQQKLIEELKKQIKDKKK